MRNFDYLKQMPQLADLHTLCEAAETRQYCEPDVSAIYCRRALEWMVNAIYTVKGMDIDSRRNLSDRVNNPDFVDFISDANVMRAIDWVRRIGNIAAHTGKVARKNAFFSVLNLYNFIGFVLLKLRVLESLSPFNEELIPRQVQPQQAPTERPVQASVEDFAAIVEPQQVADAPNVVPAVSWNSISEAETRKYYIDLMLREAGWDVLESKGKKQSSKACIEIEVGEMPNKSGRGYADYVLFGADGTPLAVIEAKRTSTESASGRSQAELYADCLEKEYRVRPVVYYTNGYEVNVIDGLGYPPRQLLGFHSEKNLVKLHFQRKNRRAIASDIAVNDNISDRHYQKSAIKAVCEHLNSMHRRGLLVMATGTGKTRTAISLVDVLDRAGWVKNVLFLADRTSLVDQAARAFAKLLPNHTTMTLSDNGKNRDFNARLVFSTYQTMINYVNGNEKKFSIGHFDLIVIDEAHRSVFGKYGSIFKYFDSLLIGLTATPREEVARSTYGLLRLDEGVPNYAYEFDEAVKDGYLVPYIGLQRESAIINDGIIYDALTDDEKQQIEEITEYEGLLDPDGNPEGRDIDKDEIYKYVFNTDTVDKVLQDLMTNGLKINSGEVIGKTIVFAFNHNHADLIVRRFNVLYPEYGEDFCRLIDNYEQYADHLILKFAERNSTPQIAVSVDMLDTGIDVPDVLNLVFFKRVRSRIKFMQMIGRGTRLCPDIFGLNKDKKEFYIFDWCSNFAYFGQNPKGQQEVPPTPSMTERIFGYRTEIAQHLQSAEYQVKGSWTKQWHDDLKVQLKNQVNSLNDYQPSVREKWEEVTRFRNPNSWICLTLPDVQLLKTDIAPLLPKTVVDTQALVMDIFALLVQLSLLDGATDSNAPSAKIKRIADKLQTLAAIPQVAEKMGTIREVLTDDFWDNVTVENIERVRKELRDLMKFLQNDGGRTFEVDIEDIIIDNGIAKAINTTVSYKQKVTSYLQEHRDLPALEKIRNMEQLTRNDIKELERILWEELGTKDDYELYLERAQLHCGNSVGAFIRTLVGVDRQKALGMFTQFISQNALNSDQEEYLKSILDYVCQNGDMPLNALVDVEPFRGIDLNHLFSDKAKDVVNFVRRLKDVIIAAS